MNRPLTGKKVAMLFVVGFGIVIAVNFYMASLAVGGFSGVVVQNSYVASQEFNGWLAKADRQQALGWDANITRDAAGTLIVSTTGVPSGAEVSAQIRRPLGEPDTRMLAFKPAQPEVFSSADPLPDGRWIVRLTILADGETWMTEKHLK